MSFLLLYLKIYRLRGTRAGDDVADIGHAGDELDEAFETETEPGVRGRAVFSQLEIPPVVIRV